MIDNDAGVAYADITTGEFKVTQFSGPDVLSELRAELARLSPAELLLPESMSAATGLTGHITLWPDWRFESGRNQETLQRHFQTASLDGYGLRNRLRCARRRRAGSVHPGNPASGREAAPG